MENLRPIPNERLYDISRAVVFPFCMTKCLTAANHGFYRCVCDGCQIADLKGEIELLGYEVLLVGSKTMTKTLKEFHDNDHRIVAIGVLCAEEVQEKKTDLKDYSFERMFHRHGNYTIPKICHGEGEDRTVEEKKPKIDKEGLKRIILDMEKEISMSGTVRGPSQQIDVVRI